MSDTTVLFLPGTAAPWRWLRITDDAISARGEGLPEIEAEAPPIVIAPAEAVTLHWAELPDRSVAQSVAAARLLAADASATPIADLHVGVGREGAHADRPIAVVALAQMRHWLAMLADSGIDPAAIIPAPMLLPRPEEGYLRADLGGEGVVRGATSGFADEARLTELVTGGVAPTVLARDSLEAAIVAGVADPALDLRQGPFSRRKRFAIDWALVRRLIWLTILILTVSLLISIVQIMKYGFAADALEAKAEQLARTGLPRGETVNNADRQLDERIARLRGAGLGFSRTAAAVFSSVRAVPGVEVTALTFEVTGDLRVTLSGEGEAQITDLKARIEAQGLTVSAGVFQSAGGRVTGDLTVKPR